ncbi:MAG TPA: hypothetical protein VJ873_09825, partial [bacterium]|nr:hypothetical protein [bacterium]
MKLFLALVVLAVVGVAGWYGYCVNPFLDQFQAAVNSGKPEAIQPFMDVPSLKKNVGDFVKLRYNRADNPSANLSPDQVNSIVDSYVTPGTVALLMKGVKWEPGSAPPDNVPQGPSPFPIDKHYESPDVYAIDVYLSQ